MPDFIKIKIRRGTSADWASSTPVLALGEIAADMDKHGLKVGNGTSRWNDLPFCSPEIINDLVTGGVDVALSAEQGKILKNLVDDKADRTDLTTLETTLRTIINSSAVVVEDNLTSYSRVNALSANQGRVLNEKIEALEVGGGSVIVEDSLESNSTSNALSANKGRELNEKIEGMGIFGMGYTVDEFNGYSKPTKITFEDGVTCTLTWTGGTQLKNISASTGEVMTISYNPDGTVIGRTITRG